MTENIAIVQGLTLEGDSVVLEALKKWKRDSIGKYVKLEFEDVLS